MPEKLLVLRFALHLRAPRLSWERPHPGQNEDLSLCFHRGCENCLNRNTKRGGACALPLLSVADQNFSHSGGRLLQRCKIKLSCRPTRPKPRQTTELLSQIGRGIVKLCARCATSFIVLTNLKAHASISAMKCMWMAELLMPMLAVAAPLMREMANIAERRCHA